MEDKLADIDKSEVILLPNANCEGQPSDKACKTHSVYIGEHIYLAVRIPLTAVALQKLKIPRGGHTPNLATNKIRNLLRELGSTVHAHASLNGLLTTGKTVTPQQAEQWIPCSVHASYHATLDLKTVCKAKQGLLCLRVEETLIKLLLSQQYQQPVVRQDVISIEGNFYVIPLQTQLTNLPTNCDWAELTVTVKPVFKSLPSWLSSPTRPEGPVGPGGEVQSKESLEAYGPWKVVTQKLRVIHPPVVLFQQKTVADKHLIMIQVNNPSHSKLEVEDCTIMPESCPKKLGKSACSTQKKSEGPLHENTCVVHSNMVKLVRTTSSQFPVEMLPGETLSLIYNLHLNNGMDYVSREDISLVAHMKWKLTRKNHLSSVQTTYRLPALKMKQAQFVLSAVCGQDSVTVGSSFDVTYSIKNCLQDFLSVKLYWNPVLQDGREEELRALEELKAGVICHDPCVQFGPSTQGTSSQVKVSFQALRPGLYEVGRHMKINLRYVIPNSETSSVSSLSPVSRTTTSLLSGEDHLIAASEELWRDRSGSGSSWNDPQLLSASDRRLSFANKSYSFGDLGPTTSSESDKDNRTKYKNIERSPTVLQVWRKARHQN